MVKWIELSTDDLYTYLAVAQVDALSEASAANEQLISNMIYDISCKIRASIQSSNRHCISERVHALPPELKSTACWLVIEYLQARIPGFRMTDDQVRLANDARSTLKQIEHGHLSVSEPDDAMYASVGVQTINCREHSVTHATMKGL